MLFILGLLAGLFFFGFTLFVTFLAADDDRCVGLLLLFRVDLTTPVFSLALLLSLGFLITPLLSIFLELFSC